MKFSNIVKEPCRKIFILIPILLVLFTTGASDCYAYPLNEDSWPPRHSLSIGINNFFGDLKGTFRFYDSKLSLQVADGLEYDNLIGRRVSQLPPIGNDLYFDSGSTLTFFPLFSAVFITPSEKVVSAALLDSAGLTIFLRASKEDNLYVAAFRKWGHDLWCSDSPAYASLGFGAKFNQKFDRSDCRPLKVNAIYLTGYGDKSVN